MNRAFLRKGLRLLAHLLTLAQLALIGGAFWLHRLSFRRGGLNHHLGFMKRKVEKLYLTDAVTAALTASALALALFLLLRGVRALRAQGGWSALSFVAGASLALAFAVVLHLPALRALPAWPVFLGVSAGAFGLQAFKLLLLNSVDSCFCVNEPWKASKF